MSRLAAVLAALLLFSVLPAAAEAAKPQDRTIKAFIHVTKHKKTKKHKKAKKSKLKAPGADWDSDGLNNRYEKKSGTKARSHDSDSDGLMDGREDRDADGVSNLTEQLGKTSPRAADSDRDGISDGDEDLDGDHVTGKWESTLLWHPRLTDSDGDDIADGDEGAGMVSEIYGDTVTIALAVGGETSGNVTEYTDVSCLGGTDESGDEGDDEDFPEDDEDWGDDDEGDDDFPEDEDWGDDDEDGDVRAATFGGCELALGTVIFESEIEEWAGAYDFVTLDLVGE